MGRPQEPENMVAVPLIFGRLEASDYENGVAADPRIDVLRARSRF
jgi:2-methylcitrate dehydratase